MKALKILAIVLVAYVAIVAAFESLLGYTQPTQGSTLVITTFDGGGAHDRVVSRLEADGKLYVATNHWPRAWYRRALGNPEVKVTEKGETHDYRAVPVTGEEHDRVDGVNKLPIWFRILTGFPPRYFFRLDSR